KLNDIHQLFNSMDPSPFHEKDLDGDAEEFMESWAHEFPPNEPLSLVVHLSQFPREGDPKSMIEQAVHHYFAYKARLNKQEFSRLMRQGRTSLLIGGVFLTGCLLA